LLAEQVILKKNILPTTIESVRDYVGVNPWFAQVSMGAFP
jgi:hypothetical protein